MTLGLLLDPVVLDLVLEDVCLMAEAVVSASAPAGAAG
jgi:hypothetical protein